MNRPRRAEQGRAMAGPRTGQRRAEEGVRWWWGRGEEPSAAASLAFPCRHRRAELSRARGSRTHSTAQQCRASHGEGRLSQPYPPVIRHDHSGVRKIAKLTGPDIKVCDSVCQRKPVDNKHGPVPLPTGLLALNWSVSQVAPPRGPPLVLPGSRYKTVTNTVTVYL